MVESRIVIKQLPLFTDESVANSSNSIEASYQTDEKTNITARVTLEKKYADILHPTNVFNRRLVSYQANKKTKMHRWFKYKEGFSAKLVRKLVDEFGLSYPQSILDPFAGVSTTLLIAQELGLNATGIEVMPIGQIVWKAKSHYRDYDLDALKSVRDWVQSVSPQQSTDSFPHVPITQFAFDAKTEAELLWYDKEFQKKDLANSIKSLLKFMLMSILEDISFTRKDGQYLRWDSRSEKVQKRNAKRVARGKKPYKAFHKHKILDVQQAIIEALDQIILDIETASHVRASTGHQELIEGTVLNVLPNTESNSFDAVITSPPYCNRYDYTRTYALELAFLGLDQSQLLDLRQSQLSCTVENKSKLEYLRGLYQQLNRLDDFNRVANMLENHQAFQEILSSLQIRNQRGEVNNKGILTMVEGYFTELAYVIFELYRVCKSGASVAIINDNVRYSSEIIPVDLLMTDFAEEFGFVPSRVYVLPQRKGNSSQQMGKYGREALRKSILIWEKK